MHFFNRHTINPVRLRGHAGGDELLYTNGNLDRLCIATRIMRLYVRSTLMPNDNSSHLRISRGPSVLGRIHVA
jgi:hypothetical protein